ncbi:MAG: ornithine carbamoyltransferase [archaeon]
MKTEHALHDEITRILETKEMKTLKGKDFLAIEDVSMHQAFMLYHLAERLKEMHARKMNIPLLLHAKNIALLFEKPSTRTRVSFDNGIALLGGHSAFIDKANTQMGRGEDWKDTAHTLNQYCDAIMARVFPHKEIEAFAKYADIPIINGLTDEDHPCQILSDYFTIREHFGKLAGLTLLYVGNADNITDSLLVGGAMLGVNVWAATPKSFPVSKRYLTNAQRLAHKTGAEIKVFHTIPTKEELKHVNVVYTDEWESMHMHLDKEKIRPTFHSFQLNDRLLNQCAKNVRAMHCLPAIKNEEITEKVMYGKRSLIWTQAKNRMYVQMALLSAILQ